MLKRLTYLFSGSHQQGEETKAGASFIDNGDRQVSAGDLPWAPIFLDCRESLRRFLLALNLPGHLLKR